MLYPSLGGLVEPVGLMSKSLSAAEVSHSQTFPSCPPHHHTVWKIWQVETTEGAGAAVLVTLVTLVPAELHLGGCPFERPQASCWHEMKDLLRSVHRYSLLILYFSSQPQIWSTIFSKSRWGRGTALTSVSAIPGYRWHISFLWPFNPDRSSFFKSFVIIQSNLNTQTHTVQFSMTYT